MSLGIRNTLAAVAVALCGAAVAPAQAPGLRQVITQPRATFRSTSTIGTVSPTPVIVLEQQQAMNSAYNNALLWQMSQPPVIVSPFPPLPYDPWNNYPQTGGYTYNWRFGSPTGSLFQSTSVFYRGNTLNWGNPYNQGWPYR